MSYYFIELEFEKIDDFNNTNNCIDIYQEFINAISSQNLIGSNFNRYYDPDHKIIHPHISIRFNLRNMEESRQQIIDYADSLVIDKKIRFHGNLEEWNEPDFVQRGHELGTKCAVIFSNNFRNSQTLQKYSKQDSTEFLFNLFYEMLSNAGYHFNLLWTYKRNDPPEELITISRRLADEIQRFRDNMNENLLERLLHTFTNCLGITGFENTFTNAISNTQIYRNILDI